MSADYSARGYSRPPKPVALSAGHKLSMKNVEAYNRNQSNLGPAVQESMVTSPSDMRVKTGFQQSVSPVSHGSYDSGMGMGMSVAPMLQTSMVPDDRQTQRSPPNLSPGPRANSQIDALKRENEELRQEIEVLRADAQDQQNAVDDMLDNVITTEGLLEDSKKALSAKEAEVTSLRSEVARLASEGQSSPLDSLMPGRRRSSTHEGDLRDLQLRCNRLKLELERKDEQLREAEDQIRLQDANQGRNSAHEQSRREVQDLRNQLAGVTHESHEHHKLAETYYQQIHDWKKAYDSLQQDHQDLHRSHSDLRQAAQAREAQPKVDDQAAKRMEAHQANELRNALEVSDFYKNNSAEVARKNKAIVAENLALQKSLHEKTRELDQQRSLIRTLQA